MSQLEKSGRPEEVMKLESASFFYCGYCDDFAERVTCDRCGWRTLSMTPVADAYWQEARALTQQPGGA